MTKKSEALIEVTATANGYYGNKVRVPGEKFGISGWDAFSDRWMTTDAAREPELRRVNTGGTDGIVGTEIPKKGAKLSAKERIEYAKSLTGREDITSAKDADLILASVAASGGSDNDDRSRDFASNPADNAPAPEAED
jgi:hypothetical protein